MEKPIIAEVIKFSNGTIINPPDESKHTEDIHEIITKVPSWILRWGITLFFGILLMAVAISVLVRYPDMVKTKLSIESSEAPITIMAPMQAKILKVFVKKDEVVKQGQQLIQIESFDNAGTPDNIKAPKEGRIAFIAIAQPGAVLKANQTIFYIHPEKEQFFGIIQIAQSSISKVKEGQDVLIKLINYPAEDYGQLKGKIAYLADEPVNGFFAARVIFTNSNALKKSISFKTWMTGQAEIITENVSLQKRIYNSIVKGLQ